MQVTGVTNHEYTYYFTDLCMLIKLNSPYHFSKMLKKKKGYYTFLLEFSDTHTKIK